MSEPQVFILGADPRQPTTCPICNTVLTLGPHTCRDVVVLPMKKLTPDPASLWRWGVCTCGERFRISWRGFASRKWVKHEHNPEMDDAGNIYFRGPICTSA